MADKSRTKAVSSGSDINRGSGKIPLTRGGDARGGSKQSGIHTGGFSSKRRDPKVVRTGSNIKRGR